MKTFKRVLLGIFIYPFILIVKLFILLFLIIVSPFTSVVDAIDMSGDRD